MQSKKSINTKKKKLCFIVSSEITVRTFLLEHIRELCALYDLYLIVNSDCKFLNEEHKLDVNVIKININRSINVFCDVISLLELTSCFLKNRFCLIHSVTPKAGFLSMVAGFITKTPVRIHIFTGQVWVTKKGLMRSILKMVDKATSMFATNVLADSHSQREYLIAQSVVNDKKISVLSNGSISGVDIDKFKPDIKVREAVRKELKIPNTSIVYLFLGRLKLDKGVIDLSYAFNELLNECNDAYLLVVGPDEEKLTEKMSGIINCDNKVRFVSYTNKPEKYMVASDVFCLPSYREGFGSVIIEAASCGIPSIGTDIYGIVDAIENGVTGSLCKKGNIESLKNVMKEYYNSEDLRKTAGNNARDRVIEKFQSKVLTNALLKYYDAVT
jgi:glycosyltransferase involved in cell wall biosynthesis